MIFDQPRQLNHEDTEMRSPSTAWHGSPDPWIGVGLRFMGLETHATPSS